MFPPMNSTSVQICLEFCTKHMDIASGVSRNVNGYWDTFVKCENGLLLELTASDMNSRWP